VILEGYEEGKAELDGDNIDTCIEVWKKYDPDHTMKISMMSALGYIAETVNTLESRKSEEGRGARHLDLSGLQGASIVDFARNNDMGNMKHLWIVTELQIDADQQVSFISSARQVLRLMSAEEFDEEQFKSLDVPESQLPDKEREKLRRLEISVTKDRGSIVANIAVQKIQDRFREKRKLRSSGDSALQGSTDLRAAATGHHDCPELVVTDDTSDAVLVPAPAG